MTDSEKAILKYLSYFLPLIYIPLGLPLALKLITPQGTYGFRTARTMGDLDTWFTVNFVGGVALIVAGLLSLSFVYFLHRGARPGSIRKLIASYFISILTLLIAIFVAFISA